MFENRYSNPAYCGGGNHMANSIQPGHMPVNYHPDHMPVNSHPDQLTTNNPMYNPFKLRMFVNDESKHMFSLSDSHSATVVPEALYVSLGNIVKAANIEVIEEPLVERDGPVTASESLPTSLIQIILNDPSMANYNTYTITKLNSEVNNFRLFDSPEILLFFKTLEEIVTNGLSEDEIYTRLNTIDTFKNALNIFRNVITKVSVDSKCKEELETLRITIGTTTFNHCLMNISVYHGSLTKSISELTNLLDTYLIRIESEYTRVPVNKFTEIDNKVIPITYIELD